MEQMENGQNVSSAAEIDWSKVEKFHNEYLGSLKVRSHISNEIECIINLSKEERDRLSPVECKDFALVLSQTAFHLQKEINKHTLCINWADRTINYLFAPSYDQYGSGNNKDFTPYEIKRMKFIRENSYAKELFKIKNAAQTRLDSINDLQKQIGFIASSYRELGNAKGYNQQ